ncbi:hypothetical protein [Gilvimarinus sp. DA14]|uniref:hypothetical protein n=1 Tax=Gilvimarinus sp. DA14 TaxID=2956798 RepID=UPI0020B70D8A|nr:hypothetical protein [Gilvimarinus sp. DA14]UTF59970.1 hypothetical protein NHM04_16090 [Gilvimarinus sp. DA14]
MRYAAQQWHQDPARQEIKNRVEKDIAALNRKIVLLESEPRRNDQLLAAYRLMLQTRTEVLQCLSNRDKHHSVIN